MSSYEIWLTTDSGSRLAQLTTFTSLSASRQVNAIGAFSMVLPQSFDINLIGVDRMIQIWRKPNGGSLSLWGVYFIREWAFSTQGGNEIVSIGGPDVNDLLRRRIVAAYAGSDEASKTDYADDMMKEIVTESQSDSVEPTPDAGTRTWSNFSVQADTSLGPTISSSFPYDYVMTSSGRGVLAVLADAAKVAGTEVFFRIHPTVSSGAISFEFQTTINQPGADVSDRVIFDLQRGNMQNPSLSYDYTDETNYIYAAGQGEAAERNIQQVYDSERYGSSKWGRIEGFADARNQKTDDGVREAGRNKLNDGRPRIKFTATPVDTAGTRYGIGWNFGDIVTSKYKNREFKSMIRAVSISVVDNKETVSARLEYEGAI